MVFSFRPFLRQAIFAGDRWKKVLADFPVDALVNKLAAKWERKSDASTSSEKWAALEKAIVEYVKPVGGANGAKRPMLAKSNEIEKWRLELVLTHCYPRLDENVSKMQNHLLKSPFCVHPKTGRVCVPIDPATAETFDPMTVPTLGTLVGEINAYDKAHGGGGSDVADVEKTSMGPYMAAFDKLFLDPMYRDIRKQLRADAELEAAAAGDF